ncbi:hypothetical protein PIROE2DRAFT_17716, partial [Piromyces sp. E2]
TQAYRYLLCAKIIDQLEEFEIQPNYERLCRSLNKYAKTTQQLKLLWGMILKKINNNVDLITSSLVSKTWNELCKDKTYSHICHFEESIITKVENSIKEHSKKLKQNQLKPKSNNNNSHPKAYSYITQKQNVINNTYLISPENSTQTNECLSNCMVIPSNKCINNNNIEITTYKIKNQYENNGNFLSINNNNIKTHNSNALTPSSSFTSLPSLPCFSSIPSLNQDNETNYVIPLTENSNQMENQINPLYYSTPTTQQTIIYY